MSSLDRRFGWTVGGVFAILGGLLLWRHRNAMAVVAFAVGGPLLLLAAFFPAGLARPPRAWLALARLFRRADPAGLLSSPFFSRGPAARFRPAPLRARRAEAARARAAFDVVALPGAESRPAPLRDDLVMRKSEVLSQLWQFLKYRKKYWLMPIVFLLVLVGLLLVLAEKSVIAPFIYTLF